MVEGGLRCNNIWKEDSDSNPLITYVTVALNSAGTIEKCIQSIVSQQNANFEYIIVDGASTDKTLNIIRRYEDRIDYFVSEKDHGIYNAMNKGIKLARGRLICFMNSDDECLPYAAEAVTEYYLKNRPDIICGDRILKQKGVIQDELLFKRFPIKHCCFRYIQMFHQSTYAARELFERIGGFDEQYTLLADWVWESKAIDADADICFINEKLSVFNYDGASFTEIRKRDAEWTSWITQSFPFLTEKEAWLLLNCMDRERHPFIMISTIRKICEKYMHNREFAKTIYESSLCILLETLDELSHRYLSCKLDLGTLWNKLSQKSRPEYETIDETRKLLVGLLTDSVAGKTKFFDYRLIDEIRNFEIQAYLYYLRKSTHVAHGLTEFPIYIIKKTYLYFSYYSCKNIFMSVIFIKLTRNSKLLQFAHRIFPRREWRRL